MISRTGVLLQTVRIMDNLKSLLRIFDVPLSMVKLIISRVTKLEKWLL